MTVERMIELLEIEKECVLRNASGECNRYCAGCDLLQDDTELHEMYTEAITLLKAQEPIEARLHLCESCKKLYPECDATADGIEFGCGVGNDNIIGCAAYENRWKAQEPRMMTMEEIGNALKTPLWKETKRTHKDLYTGWVLAYDIQTGAGITGTRLGMSEPSGRVVWYRLDDYGKTWRCWTSHPDEKRRAETLWE